VRQDERVSEQKRRMLAGEPYRDSDPELMADRQRCRQLLSEFNTATEESVRRSVLTKLFADPGDGSQIMPRLVCDYGYRITLGNNSFVNCDAVLLDCAPIVIGDDVLIGPRVQLLTPLHPIEDHELRRQRWETAAPITIGDNVWLGGGVIVCAGVTIGRDTVVGAGSVVTRDLPGKVLAVGNPCRAIRQL
jgi:maltose O-acetyltransferase